MFDDDLTAAIDGTSFSPNLAGRYLAIYHGRTAPEWEEGIAYFQGTKRSRELNHQDSNKYRVYCRDVVSFAVLGSKFVAEDVSCGSHIVMGTGMQEFQQPTRGTWFGKLSIGVIDPIEFQPFTRQAFNWLYEQATKTGVVTKESEKRFRNLVWIYGGMAISNIFTRHEVKLKKVLNWRSGYFFERVLHEVYTFDQLQKIKQLELERTSEKLIRKA